MRRHQSACLTLGPPSATAGARVAKQGTRRSGGRADYLVPVRPGTRTLRIGCLPACGSGGWHPHACGSGGWHPFTRHPFTRPFELVTGSRQSGDAQRRSGDMTPAALAYPRRWARDRARFANLHARPQASTFHVEHRSMPVIRSGWPSPRPALASTFHVEHRSTPGISTTPCGVPEIWLVEGAMA